MNIRQLDAVAAALFPKHYTPQFDIVFPEAERLKIEKCSDKDRELYALSARYSPEKALEAYRTALKGCGGGCDANSRTAREKTPSRAEFEEKYADLATHYFDECKTHWKDSGYVIVEQLTARVSDAVKVFEAAVAAWDREASTLAGVSLPLTEAFATVIDDIRRPLKQNLEQLRSPQQALTGNLGFSVGDFVAYFIGVEFRPLSEFLESAEK
jgi:hypothetical protein